MRIFFILVGIAACLSPARANPPIEAYGQLPNMRSLAISPSGDRVVYLSRQGDREFAAVYSFSEQKPIAAAAIDEVKARRGFFASEDFVILSASETTSMIGIRDDFEYSAAIAWNLKTGRIKQLLRGEEGVFLAQTGLGRIVGREKNSEYIFMPAYMGSRYVDPDYDLLRVNLETGRARTHERGRQETIDWVVRDDGEVVAREDYDQDSDKYSIWLYEEGGPRKIFEEEASIPRFSLLGVKPDDLTILASVRLEDSDRNAIVEISRAGEVSEPLFARDDADVERVLSDENRVVYGVKYSGLTPSYEFFDDRLNDLLRSVQASFPGAAVTLTDWTNEFKELVFYVAGGHSAPAFYVMGTDEKRLVRVGSPYEGVSDEQTGQVFAIDYRTRDGQELSAILTIPPGAEMAGAHPTIMMPHGGPASYDAIGFDWMAQYFANRGYAVVQPNFRGSDGFGHAFRLAGHGEWGRGVMQHDVTDALSAVVNSGISDPERVCIVGGSYGGYAALAGGAFTPELYKCIAAFAPVADLPRMIYDERRQSGRNSWVVTYWTNSIGDVKAERQKLEDISPANFAEAFQAPVLLIHGNDDTVVPYRQSEIMERALKRAGKDVELVKLKGGDHWLSTSEMRLDTLRALDGFVTKHLGAN